MRKTDADAENEQKIEKAKTDAESLWIAARSNADTDAAAILTKAKATAEAIRQGSCRSAARRNVGLKPH